MCEILWSDPHPLSGRRPSQRGVGIAFGTFIPTTLHQHIHRISHTLLGPDVSKAFLDDNNLDLLVRSHEVKNQGYEVTHEGRVITVFSAPNYCDSMGNKVRKCLFDGHH